MVGEDTGLGTWAAVVWLYLAERAASVGKTSGRVGQQIGPVGVGTWTGVL